MKLLCNKAVFLFLTLKHTGKQCEIWTLQMFTVLNMKTVR
nr:MAG TPA: hypothetical protein [Caudoviricetes sp.]